MTAGSLRPGDDDFASLFADFIVEQSGGADEPIDRRVFELVDGRLVEFAGDPARRLMAGERAAPAFTSLRYEVADSIATITLDRPEALNALTVTAQGGAAGGLPVGRPRSRGPGGRADRRRPGVLRRPGPQGAAPARRGAAGGRAARALQPDHPRRCAGSTSRSSARSTGSPRAPGHRSPSPATSGSPPRRPASCWPSAGSGWSRTADRPGSCRAWSARPRRPSWPCSASRCRRVDAERFGLVARVVPGDALADEARAVASRLAGLAPHRPRPDQARARAELVDRARRRRSRMRPTARASRARRPTTPRASRRSSRNGRLGSAGSSRDGARPAPGAVPGLAPPTLDRRRHAP